MKSDISVPAVALLALIAPTLAAIGVVSTVGTSIYGTGTENSVVLPVNTSLKVSSGFDCVAEVLGRQERKGNLRTQ